MEATWSDLWTPMTLCNARSGTLAWQGKVYNSFTHRLAMLSILCWHSALVFLYWSEGPMISNHSTRLAWQTRAWCCVTCSERNECKLRLLDSSNASNRSVLEFALPLRRRGTSGAVGHCAKMLTEPKLWSAEACQQEWGRIDPESEQLADDKIW